MELHRSNQLLLGNFSSFSRLTSVKLAVVLAAASALVPAQVVLAQGAQAIEEIVVTARKRQETLQEVPVVVNVLTEEAIDSQRIEGIKDIATIVPGMVASKTISGTSGFIYLRGVGTGSGNPGFDQAVAINVDGMGINSAQMLNAGMFDLRQIEVLKGPQALFYGKNSPGGVIAIHTNDPGDEFELELTGMYETVAEETTLRGIISGPLSDTLGARIAFGRSEADDSWIDVVNSDQFETGPAGPVQTAFGTGNSELETSFVLGTLLWEPAENFSAKLKYARLQDNQTGTPYDGIQKVWCGTGAVQAIYPVAGVDNCKADDEVMTPGINPSLNGLLKNGEFAGETQGFFDNENDFAVLEVNYHLDNGLTFTAVTGFFENEELRFADASFQVASGLPVTNGTKLDQWSQELRLASNFDGNLNFTLGAFYEEKEIERDTDVIAGGFYSAPFLIGVLGDFPIFAGRQISDQEGTSYSVFGQVNWDLSESWTLAIGGRYSSEEKENRIQVERAATPQFGLPAVARIDIPLLNPKEDWSNFSPEATLSYQHNDNVMFFASYREGFKSGGYDFSYGIGPKVAIATTPGASLDNLYNEENVDGFEVGMKSTLLDGTLRLNVTAYSFAYEDLQLSKFDGTSLSFSIFNAGKASVDGLEVESLWLTPVEGLSLTANVAWGKSEFDEFIAPCWAGQTIALGCNREPHPITANFTGSDRSGDNLPFASDLSATLGLNYEARVSGNWNLGLSLTASFKDDYNPVPELPPDDVRQDGYWWVNAGVSLYSSDDKWEFFIRGVNLADEVYKNSGAPAPNQGNAATTGTNDASGLPDFISYISGGRQFNVGITYRM